jgi:hypothetical protein
MSGIVFLKIEKTGVTRVIPIVDNAEGESSRLVGEGEVYLMAVAIMLAEGNVTPCGEGESFPSDGKLRLYGDMSQTKSTPDVAAHEVRLQTALHFILCLHGAEDAEHKDSQYKCCSHVCKDNVFLL